MLILLILLAIPVALGLWGAAVRNGLVRARNAYRNAFAQIDMRLQRRFDLNPNRVETAKGNRREAFPASIVAGMGGFAPATPLAIPGDRAAVREAPKVAF